MQPSREGVSMTKLMAFDLDGTILFNRAVEPANEQAIARWQAEG